MAVTSIEILRDRAIILLDNEPDSRPMSERTFLTSGIRVLRLRGIDVWIHWSLLLWFAYTFYLNWVDLPDAAIESILKTVVWWAAVFLSILVHELGHCYAAFRQGGGADAIVLWPLGGLAHCDAPHLPGSQFWVAAGGPLAQCIPTAISGLLILALGLDPSAFPTAGESYLEVALGALFWWNLILLAFNLLPLYPFDGGRMLQAILWRKLGSHGRATVITVWTSRITILLGAFVLLFILSPAYRWPALFILMWALWDTERLWVRLQSGEEEEGGAFGYDFSRGYSSADRTATREKNRAGGSILGRLRGRSRETRRAREAEVRRRVDILLEKISRDGLGSLSRRERKFLEQASRKYREE
jgi:stage IV sporulation protein FB